MGIAWHAKYTQWFIELRMITVTRGKNEKSVAKSNKFQTEKVMVEEALNPDIPLYRKNPFKNFWSCFIDKEIILYINYNCCKDMQDTTVESFCTEQMRFIKQKNAKRLVIDLHKNLGGNSTLFEPFIRELRKCKKLNKEGIHFHQLF